MRAQPGLVLVTHTTAAAFLRHLFTLHYLPDVLVLHNETPCGGKRTPLSLLSALFGNNGRFSAAKMLIIVVARLSTMPDVAPAFAVGAADVLLLPCEPNTLATRIAQHMKVFGDWHAVRRAPQVRSLAHRKLDFFGQSSCLHVDARPSVRGSRRCSASYSVANRSKQHDSWRAVLMAHVRAVVSTLQCQWHHRTLNRKMCCATMI